MEINPTRLVPRFACCALVLVAACAVGPVSGEDDGANARGDARRSDASRVDVASMDAPSTRPGDGAFTLPPGACVDGAVGGLDPIAAGLPQCCTGDGGSGRAHCVPDALVGARASILATCPTGGRCVPDVFIRGGPGFRPPACTSAFMTPGVCVSTCVPMVAMNAALLRQRPNPCGEDEVCVPCVNPLDSMPTGVCDAPPMMGGLACGEDGGGSSGRADAASTGDGPVSGGDTGSSTACPGPMVIDPTSFPTCCPGARCVPDALVPAASRDMLAPCAGGRCVPENIIARAGRFLPATCAPFGRLGEGRCLSTCIPQVMAQAAQLSSAGCATSERCVPCFDPRTGMDTGACRQGCDTGPTMPPFRLPMCCSGRGTCAPTAAVPMSSRSSLTRRDCPDSFLCVPNELADPARPMVTPCSGVADLFFVTRPYTGVCISNCADFGFIGRLTLDRGTCASGFTCAPCRNPLTGAATGAPGCP